MRIQSRSGHATAAITAEEFAGILHRLRMHPRLLVHSLATLVVGHCITSACLKAIAYVIPVTVPGPQTTAGLFGNGGNTLMIVMMMWLAIALGLFFLRPKSLRANPEGKPSTSVGIFMFIHASINLQRIIATMCAYDIIFAGWK